MDRKVSISRKVRGMLRDNYTLFESGEILHEFDKHIYPAGQNLREKLNPGQVSDEVKHRLLNAAPEAGKGLVKNILGIK